MHPPSGSVVERHGRTVVQCCHQKADPSGKRGEIYTDLFCSLSTISSFCIDHVSPWRSKSGMLGRVD